MSNTNVNFINSTASAVELKIVYRDDAGHTQTAADQNAAAYTTVTGIVIGDVVSGVPVFWGEIVMADSLTTPHFYGDTEITFAAFAQPMNNNDE
jgi:diphthamide synthase (EF-2-diphthine--ammonia ligase)